MIEKRFIINTNVCISCHSCQYACAEKNGLAKEQWRRRVILVRQGDTFTPYSLGCNHCLSPACVAACPTKAMVRDEERGLVLHRDSFCIGCGSCVWACPYGAVSIDPYTGLASKCDGCAEETKNDGVPACAAACPTKALQYEAVEEFEKEYVVTEPDLAFLPDPKETRPGLRLIRKKK